MPRYFWISASIAILVAAFALMGIAHRQVTLAERADGSGSRLAESDVRVYSVPPSRGQAITQALNTVLLTAPREGVLPLGAANLTAPDQLVVSAPEGMQGSIRKAIEALSKEGAEGQVGSSAVALDLWLVEASGAGPEDARLAEAGPALAEARNRFGYEKFRLLDRLMLVGRPDGETVRARGSRTSSSVDLTPHDARTVEAEVEFQVLTQPQAIIESKLLLQEGQWHLVGLLPGAGEDRPERLLLMRQTTSSAAIAHGP